MAIGGRTRICSGKHGAAQDVTGVTELPLRHTPKLQLLQLNCTKEYAFDFGDKKNILEKIYQSVYFYVKRILSFIYFCFVRHEPPLRFLERCFLSLKRNSLVIFISQRLPNRCARFPCSNVRGYGH